MITARMLPNVDKGLAHHVFRKRRISHDPQDEAINLQLVPRNKAHMAAFWPAAIRPISVSSDTDAARFPSGNVKVNMLIRPTLVLQRNIRTSSAPAREPDHRAGATPGNRHL